MLHAGKNTILTAADHMACRSFNEALSASIRGKPIETSAVTEIAIFRRVFGASSEARRKTGKTFRTEPLSEFRSVLNVDFRSSPAVLLCPN
jgi:hypothetical protein